MPKTLMIAVIALALIGVLAIVLVGYLGFVIVRFNRRNPHARDASKIRRRVDGEITGGHYEDGIRIYRELRELVSANPREPDLVCYLMQAAEPIARAAAARHDIPTAIEIFRDAQEVTHVAAMPVLRELLPSFLRPDRGKALVCVELLARLAEQYPKKAWLYWSAKRQFSDVG